MIQVVIVNGRPESGKTTFEGLVDLELMGNILQKSGNTKAYAFSTVDFVKFIAAECGWNGTKTPRNRKFLSDLKDLLTEWDDVPFKKIVREICELKDETFNSIAFVDCREPKEIEKLKKHFNAMTLLVRRLGDEEQVSSNHADANIFNYEYDYIVENYGTIEDLTTKARMFIEFMESEDGKKYAFSD